MVRMMMMMMMWLRKMITRIRIVGIMTMLIKAPFTRISYFHDDVDNDDEDEYEDENNGDNDDADEGTFHQDFLLP